MNNLTRRVIALDAYLVGLAIEYRVERREFRLMLEREKPEPVAQTV